MAQVKLEYGLAEDDLVAFNMYYAGHSKLHRSVWRRTRALSSAIPVIFGVGVYAFDHDAPAAAVFVALAIVWYLVCPRALAGLYRRHFLKHIREVSSGMPDDPVTIEPSDDGIYGTSSVGETKYNYTAVGEIVEDGGYTFVFLGKGMAFILPHDRIPKQDIDAFVAEIERHRADAPCTTPD